MATFVLTVLYTGQSMSSDKSLTETFNNLYKKPWVLVTQGFFCCYSDIYNKIDNYGKTDNKTNGK